jgi:hypothetical protein
MSRVLGRPASQFEHVADYEAVGAPVFAWRDAVARDGRTGSALNGIATVGAWKALGGRPAGGTGSGRVVSTAAANGHRPSRRSAWAGELRRRALVAGFPLAVHAMNRAGLGPLRAEISMQELRQAGLRAMGEVAARLQLGEAHVVFGHTHRVGPLPGDAELEWRGRGGARLLNTGSWTFAGVFLGTDPAESPYWPGACVLVEDSGPPVVRRLLQDRTREQIRPPRRRAGEVRRARA